MGAASAIAQALVVARTEVELVDSACIVVRGSGIGGVKLRCTLVSCIVVSERRSIRFVRTCTVMHKEQKEGKGKAHTGRGGTIDAVGLASWTISPRELKWLAYGPSPPIEWGMGG